MNKVNKNPDKEQAETTSEQPLKNPDDAIQQAYRAGFKDGFHEADQLLEEDDEPLSEDNE